MVPLVALAVTVLVIFSDNQQGVRSFGAWMGKASIAIENQSMFGVADQIYLTAEKCRSEYLVLCARIPAPPPCSRPAFADGSSICLDAFASLRQNPRATNGPSSAGPVAVLAAAAELLPKLPVVTYRVLHERWAEGGLAFMIGISFVMAYLTLAVIGVRYNVFAGALAIVLGPLPVAALFWLIQQALVPLTAWLSALAACALACCGVPCMCYLCAFHALGSLHGATRAIGRGLEF
ncbi:MAG: hypothetical protein ACREEB_14490 [Caulobacteraceae bacterium]